MTGPQVISDELWQHLDPAAGRLQRRGRVGVAGAILTSILVLGLAIVAAVTGAVVPRVSGSVRGAELQPGRRTISLQVEVDNAGAAPVDVSRLVTDPSRFEITSAPTPFAIAGHDSRLVPITVTVTSCTGGTSADVVPVGIVVHHWWGDREQTLIAADNRFYSFYSDMVASSCRSPG